MHSSHSQPLSQQNRVSIREKKNKDIETKIFFVQTLQEVSLQNTSKQGPKFA